MTNIEKMFKELVLSVDKDDTFFGLLRYLTKLGFTNTLHAEVPDRGDGYKGKIDIIAQRNDLKLAIMLDNLEPRLKSINKLKSIPPGFVKVIICRKVAPYKKIKDFHFVYPRFLKGDLIESLPENKPVLIQKRKAKKTRDFEKKFRLIK